MKCGNLVRIALAVAAIFLVVFVFITIAFAHEHKANETPEQARVIEFLRSWKRPMGPYSGVSPRTMSCCYINGLQQDCFAVKQVRIVDGAYEVFPDVEGHLEYARWYHVPPSIDEANQADPRESPDGRSYVCIAGQSVICFVAGTGL
jgi:hypothetical protein